MLTIYVVTGPWPFLNTKQHCAAFDALLEIWLNIISLFKVWYGGHKNEGAIEVRVLFDLGNVF